MTRDEFIADLKERVLELARVGDLTLAVAMLAAEINNRPDLKIHMHHATLAAGTLKAMSGDKLGVIEWIESVS